MFSLISGTDGIITLRHFPTRITSDMVRDLTDLRREIDALDDQLHDLLRQRTEIVKEVRTYKQNERIKIRPAREAEIIYRLFAQHSGPFPKREMFRIWRELIVATLRMEGAFSVGVYMSGDDCGFWDLARDQFGSFSPMLPFPSTRRIIEVVQKQEVTVGILPLPERNKDKPWWRRLVFEDDSTPRIIARLPFVPGCNARASGREALVICPVPQEPTGRDRTYLALESDQQLAPAKLTSALSDVGLPVVFTTDCLDPSRPQIWQTLVEVDGFATAEDPRVKAVEDVFENTIKRVVSLGGYATQIDESELE
jgi:chorismate mutase